MADWDTVADTYSDAVAAVLPLRRIALVGIGMLEAYSIRDQAYKSVTETMVMHPLKSLTAEDDGLFVDATVADICISLGLVIAACFVSSLMLKVIFSMAARAVDLKERMKAVTQSAAGNMAVRSIDDLEKLSKFVEGALGGVRKKLRSVNAAAEFCAGVSVAAFVGAHWGNILDVLIGALALVLVLALHIQGVKVFLSRYMGPALLQARYLGQPFPEPGDAAD